MNTKTYELKVTSNSNFHLDLRLEARTKSPRMGEMHFKVNICGNETVASKMENKEYERVFMLNEGKGTAVILVAS